FKLRVRSASPYVGVLGTSIDLKQYSGLTLVSAVAADGSPLRTRPFSDGDFLIVRGDAEAAARLASDQGLAFRLEDAPGDVAETLFNRASGLAEVVIPPRSGLLGQAVFPGMVTDSGDLVILDVQRRGEEQGPDETMLEVGGKLLLQGKWKEVVGRLASPDAHTVETREHDR